VSSRAFIRVALVLIAVLGILVVAVSTRGRWHDAGQGSVAEGEPAVRARTDITPRIVLFGDTVTALVEVTLARDRVDPDSVRVQTDFAPWRPLGEPQHARTDGESTTSLRTSYLLRCVTNRCISDDAAAVQNDTEVLVFEQAKVTYTDAADASRVSLEVPWPRLTVGARFSARDALSAGASTSGWRVDLLSLPAFSYRLTPGLLLALLLAAGIVLAIVGGVFVRLARRRRGAPPARVDATEPPTAGVTPLDRALALLEDSTRVDGAADQRRALELVAAALEGRGDPRLARESRTLAWSEPIPNIRETNGVAARARPALGKELHEHVA
jgi:hypothetical protein